MPEPGYTAINKLGQVINTIQLGRKTGILTVVRGTGAKYEEGTITFVNGRPTHASIGERSSADALRWIATWEACKFAFKPFISPDMNTPHTGPLQPDRAVPDTPPRLDLYPGAEMFSTETGHNMPIASREFSPVPYQSMHPDGKSLLWTTPHRIRQLDEALYLLDHLRLSRAHRRLFLLIDGQRTVKDLLILMGRTLDDVSLMLHQLTQADLIRF